MMNEKPKNLKNNRKMRRKVKLFQVWTYRSVCLLLIFFFLFLSFHIFQSIREISKLLFTDYKENSIVSVLPEENKADAFSTQNSNTASQNLPWYLTLVNSENPLPKNYSIELTQLKNNQAIDSRCYPDLQDMMDDCRKAGFDPLICSSYRTAQKQETLFQNEINKYIAQGYSSQKAAIETAKSVAIPGTSEHQLGLALDIVDVSNQRLDSSQEKTKVQKWLMKNSWKYGFVLRYPNEKSSMTGIIYEPWHYRYVGKEAAKEMYEKNMCLEEYLSYLTQ